MEPQEARVDDEDILGKKRKHSGISVIKLFCVVIAPKTEFVPLFFTCLILIHCVRGKEAVLDLKYVMIKNTRAFSVV
jgi:hypothetical protein